jgi:hypothetical protein
MYKKYYILNIKDKDPMPLIGPYKTFRGMLPRAKKIFGDRNINDTIYWVCVEDSNPIPFIGAFGNKDLDVF